MKLSARWLLLIHQIPPKPAYFRARVGRRLLRLGAVAIKNAVYALPATDSAREELQALAREIAADGGEGTVCAASLVEGLADAQVEELFRSARAADYAELAREMHAGDAELARHRKRLAEIIAIDFFDAPGRAAAEAALRTLDHPDVRASKHGGKARIADYQHKTWVTRKNIHADRIACSWLVRRFIDPMATFRFVAADGFRPKPNEVSFDMASADFTHVDDQCSFETIVRRFGLREPGLAAVAEIIHDLDIDDAKYARAEAPGVGALLDGIAAAHAEDERRVDVGSAMLDALLAGFARRNK